MTKGRAAAAGKSSTEGTEASDLRTEIDVQGPTSPGDSLALATTSAEDLLVRGDLLGRYVVLELLGAGGMGKVYAAYDPMLDRRIALKVLRHTSGVDEVRRHGHKRLLREAQALAKLNHPNIVKVYDVGEVGEQVYIAMEYVAGQDLRAWLAAAKRSWREIVEVFVEAGCALQAAHEMDIVHRDFKPENVLVSDAGQVLVIDFGIARLYAEAESPVAGAPAAGESFADLQDAQLEMTATAAGIALGTPAYMALEQFLGEAEPRTDQFSFAVCLFEALYGTAPYEGTRIHDRVENLRQGRVASMPADTQVPQWLHDVILRALQAEMDDRFPSMIELLDQLRVQDEVLSDDNARLLKMEREQDQALGSRRRVAAGVVGAIFVVTLSTVFYLFNSGIFAAHSQSRIFLIGMTFWLGIGGLILYWRDVFLANQYNARWAQMIMATLTAVVAHRALAWIGESDPTQIVQVDILLLAVCALLSAPLSRLFYVVAVVLTVMCAWALLQPSFSRLLIFLGGVFSALSILGIWVLKHREAQQAGSQKSASKNTP